MIQIKDLKKSFNEKTVTNGLSLDVETGEFLVIIGRSGEGKSVLLKQIIGLIEPDFGSIVINGKDIAHVTGKEREAVYREFGYVFQFAALLDSLNVFDNVGLALLENGVKPESIREQVLTTLRSVGLTDDIATKFPDELSGGMRKRVGLARTLMLNPKILLYDEPTTGLDPITVRLIHELMLSTHKKFNTTTVVISHDVEIFKYATQVAMLFNGRIIYKGDAKTIWDCTDPYVYQFIRGLADGPIK